VNETDYFGSQWWETGAKRTAEEAIPSKYTLHQNYPNPFNPTTVITYDLPSSGRVSLTIFNALGQKITSLVDKEQQAGSYRVTWDGLSGEGTQMANGVYFYYLRTSSFNKTMKMVLMR
ncbi:MAG: T9SS type A sorting domain-containing protein, partial [Actinobacteria bacterium]|nr:T9SS type A sorting domain-containing protein [Actinomycetota bacterium]